MLAVLTVALVSVPAWAGVDVQPTSGAGFDRLGWGQGEGGLQHRKRGGIGRWLNSQARPYQAPRLPPEVQARVDAYPLDRKPMAQWIMELDAQRRGADQITDPAQRQMALLAINRQMDDLANQARARTIYRALYASNQLQERMAWFWTNHFSIFSGKANIRLMLGDYDDVAIRPHTMGRFRDLLEATLKHPAMLKYLDSADNSVGHINENYAREIMELHTMGVGSGYSQRDIEELARIMTGVGIDMRPEPPRLKPAHANDLIREGMFEFNPDRHDYGDKVFLGHRIAGSGYAEVEQALDILCRQPATAHHISENLAAYFVGDAPPQRLVDRMTSRFLRSDGDIAAVLETLFNSAEFKASLGRKFKDSVEYVLSAIRYTYGDKVILNPKPIQEWIGRLGEGLYDRVTPDGYPLDSKSWSGPGQMTARFEVARQIGFNSAGLFREPGATTDAPAFPQLQNRLYFEQIEPTLSEPTRAALSQATSSAEWNALFLSSPEFMRH